MNFSMQYAKCDRNRVKGHSKEHTNKSYGEESKREQEKHLIEVGAQFLLQFDYVVHRKASPMNLLATVNR